MNEYKVVNKTFVKSKNSVHKINMNYTYSLLAFIILTIINYIVLGDTNAILPLIKSLMISIITASLIDIIISLTIKKQSLIKIYTEDNIQNIALIMGLFGTNSHILILILAVTITVLIKKLTKNINLSATIYGIIILLIYKYITNHYSLTDISLLTSYHKVIIDNPNIIDFLLGSKCLSPIISIIIFIYLLFKKSIKYNIFIAYNLTTFFIYLLYTIFNDLPVIFIVYTLSISNTIFLSVYALTDYGTTPTLSEIGVIYGMILGIISAILTFIVPDFALIISIIIGKFFLTSILEKYTPQLKYYKKKYNLSIIICTVILIITPIILTLINN